MKKNYEKIYKRLIKEIKRLVKEHYDPKRSSFCSNDSILREVEKRESGYGLSILKNILEMNQEIEGKKCNMIIMDKDDLKKWRKEITL